MDATIPWAMLSWHWRPSMLALITFYPSELVCDLAASTLMWEILPQAFRSGLSILHPCKSWPLSLATSVSTWRTHATRACAEVCAPSPSSVWSSGCPWTAHAAL